MGGEIEMTLASDEYSRKKGIQLTFFSTSRTIELTLITEWSEREENKIRQWEKRSNFLLNWIFFQRQEKKRANFFSFKIYFFHHCRWRDEKEKKVVATFNLSNVLVYLFKHKFFCIWNGDRKKTFLTWKKCL